MSDTLERVKQVTAEILKIDKSKIGDNARFAEDLGGDSVKAAELIAGLELEFGIEMSPRQALAVKSVSDAVTFIDTLVAGN